MSGKQADTGVFPVGGEGNRWAYMRDGLVIWSGSEEECRRRLYLSRDKLYAVPTHPIVVDEAIRRLSPNQTTVSRATQTLTAPARV